jgi:hypothetical protein
MSAKKTTPQSGRFNPEIVGEIVRQTRLNQGLPPKVQSANVIAKLAVFVGSNHTKASR